MHWLRSGRRCASEPSRSTWLVCRSQMDDRRSCSAWLARPWAAGAMIFRTCSGRASTSYLRPSIRSRSARGLASIWTGARGRCSSGSGRIRFRSSTTCWTMPPSTARPALMSPAAPTKALSTLRQFLSCTKSCMRGRVVSMPPVLEEGLAIYFGDPFPLHEMASRERLVELLNSDEMVSTNGEYARAGHFIAFLVESFGWKFVMKLDDELGQESSPAQARCRFPIRVRLGCRWRIGSVRRVPRMLGLCRYQPRLCLAPATVGLYLSCCDLRTDRRLRISERHWPTLWEGLRGGRD